MRDLPGLRRLDLRDPTLADAGDLRGLPLESLALYAAPGADPAFLADLPQLRRLEYGYADPSVFPEFAAALAKMTALETLVWVSRLPPPLAPMPALQKVYAIRLDEAGASALAACPALCEVHVRQEGSWAALLPSRVRVVVAG